MTYKQILQLTAISGFSLLTANLKAQDEIKPKQKASFFFRSNFIGTYTENQELEQKALADVVAICEKWRSHAQEVLDPTIAIAECTNTELKRVYRVRPKVTGKDQALLITNVLKTWTNTIQRECPSCSSELLGYYAVAKVFVAAFKQTFSGFEFTAAAPGFDFESMSNDDLVRTLYSQDTITAKMCEDRERDFARGSARRLITCERLAIAESWINSTFSFAYFQNRVRLTALELGSIVP